MYQSYRIGNDIPFRWPIYTGRDIDRVPFDLTGRKLTLEAISKTGKSYPIEMTTDGNIVQGTFYGKDQKAIGPYVLVLTENKDEVGMRTIDTCEFVELVDRSYKATGGSNDIIHYDVLELSGSRVATYSGVVDSELSETSANPVENRVVTKALNEIGNKTADGLDAKLDKDAVVQEYGTGTDKVMSQKVVTELFEALTKALELKQEKLTAGRGISIEGGVISSTLDTKPFVVVSSLPATGDSEKIYLVPAEKQEEGNLTDEWIWNNGMWERLGSAKVDLTPYLTKEEWTETMTQFEDYYSKVLSSKVDKEEGKELSSNDYTDAEKAKLAGLQNYDDTEVRELINDVADSSIDKKYGLNVVDYYTYKLSSNVINSIYSIGEGWAGNMESGFSHEKGYTEPLMFSLNAAVGDKLLITFDGTGVTKTTDILVSIGTSVQLKSYYAGTPFRLGLKYRNGYLTLTPLNDFAGTLTNIKARIIDRGTEEETVLENVAYCQRNNLCAGFWNIIIGTRNKTAESLQYATRSIIMGYNAASRMEAGHRNVAIGSFAMSNLTTAENNVAIGSDTLYVLSKAEDCVAIGMSTIVGQGTEATSCVAIGSSAMGTYDFYKNRSKCVAVGHYAGPSISENCTHVGYRAGANVVGNNNTSLGYNSMAVGERSTIDILGSELTCVGYMSQIANTTEAKAAVNSTALGANTKITKSNQLILGNSAVEEVLIAGKKLIFNSDGIVTWDSDSGLKSQPIANGVLVEGVFNTLTLAEDVAFTLGATDKAVPHYLGELTTGDTVPTVTWPDGVTWDDEPSLAANCKYQFSILNGLGVIREFPIITE